MDWDFNRPSGCSSASTSTSLDGGNSSLESWRVSGTFDRGAGGAGAKILILLLLTTTTQFIAM
jgi:hypothetical protein